MESRKINIMPYIFVCGMAVLNLLLMALPFLQIQHLLSISGYVLISTLDGAVGFLIGMLQVIIMLLLFIMLIYGAIGILYACGISGVDMSNRKFRLFCAFPIVVLDILYFVQFIFIVVYASVNRCGVDMGIYISFFLNISLTIIYSALLKTPKKRSLQLRTPTVHFNGDPTSYDSDSEFESTTQTYAKADSPLNSKLHLDEDEDEVQDNLQTDGQQKNTVYKNDSSAINHVLGQD